MKLNHQCRLSAILLAFAILSATVGAENSPFNGGDTNSDVVGTWTGKSICVGYRPACKNEEVVYRFAIVPGRIDLVTQYADKILDGKRVPMGKLDFVYDKAKGTLSSEFTVGHTHGVWSYSISGDNLKGTLIILPDKTLGRTVEAHRVAEDKVPKAPPLTDY